MSPAVSEHFSYYTSSGRICQAENRPRLIIFRYGRQTSFAPFTFTPGPMVEATTQLLIY